MTTIERPAAPPDQRRRHHRCRERGLRSLAGDARREPALDLREDEQAPGDEEVLPCGVEPAEALDGRDHGGAATLRPPTRARHRSRGGPRVVLEVDPCEQAMPASGATTGGPGGGTVVGSTPRRLPMTETSITLPTRSGAARPVAAPRRDPAAALGRPGRVAAPILALFATAAGAPLYADDLSRRRVDRALHDRLRRHARGARSRWCLRSLALYLAQHRRLQLAPGARRAADRVHGTVLAAGGAWDSLFTVPYLAEEAPAVLDADTTGLPARRVRRLLPRARRGLDALRRRDAARAGPAAGRHHRDARRRDPGDPPRADAPAHPPAGARVALCARWAPRAPAAER